jgi:hypothetical protein
MPVPECAKCGFPLMDRDGLYNCPHCNQRNRISAETAPVLGNASIFTVAFTGITAFFIGYMFGKGKK